MTVRQDDLSRWVSGVLQIGGLISIGIVAVGVVLGLDAVTRAGLFVVLLTPIGRLTAAGAAFLRHRERKYAFATAVVLALLLSGLAVAALAPRVGS
ncbi:MAG: DUF1634 domain-containing protein [Candidatus Limnocylindria bacterium]